ncbi:potassium channel family protein [Nonomuraea ferruginea]
MAGVVLFALADYNVAYWREGEFAGLETRTDALYFAVSTLATVGFGDVHAQGQLARGLVLVQMAFNLIVLATAATLLTGKLKAGQARRRAR